MIQYGEKKMGSGKVHAHNKCSICSEKNINKKSARQEAKKEIEKEVTRYKEI